MPVQIYTMDTEVYVDGEMNIQPDDALQGTCNGSSGVTIVPKINY